MSKKSTYDVAIVGATGAVGSELLQVLTERGFPVGRLLPLASARRRPRLEMTRRVRTMMEMPNHTQYPMTSSFMEVLSASAVQV